MAVMGITRAVKEAYPDQFAFDEKQKYYDAKSTARNPRWVMWMCGPLPNLGKRLFWQN